MRGRGYKPGIMPRMATKQAVIVQALQLSEGERLEVAEALYESLEGRRDADVERAWSEEIRGRVEELDGGHVKLVPWEEARERIVRDGGGDAAD